MGRASRRRGQGQDANLFAPLKNDLGLRGGKGGAFTHTRASTTLTVDSSGYYQSVASGVAAYDTNGLRVTPQLTNKCQCYGLIPDDAEQTALTSGTMTVGKVYKIKVQESTTDFVADGAANPHAVGDTFVCTAATVTLTATKSVAEMQWAVGTKSFYNGSTWVQNIAGVQISGYGSALNTGTLEIVLDSVAITSGNLQYINTNSKVLKFIATDANQLYISGTVGNTNAHSLSVVAREAVSGTSEFGIDGGTRAQITGTSYAVIKKENVTPATADKKAYFNCVSSTIFFLLPGLYETTVAPLYPIVANSTSGTTTRAQVTATIPLAPNFRQASGMLYLTATPDFAAANIPINTQVAIATLNSGTAKGLLYFATDGSGNGSLNAFDGTNTATIAWTSVAGTPAKVGCRWNTALNELQVSLNGTNGTATSYDGGFTVDGQNKIYLQGIAGGFSIKNVFSSADRGAAALAAATT